MLTFEIFSRTIPKNGFESHSSPSTYLRAYLRMPILDWEMGPNWSHQRIYGHIFTHYPEKWHWVPFKPINVSTGIFTDAHSGLGNGTKWVPSTYLRAYFQALSRKMTLSSIRAHQHIYGHIYGCPFWTGKWDQTGPINVSTVIFSGTIRSNGFRFHLRPSTYLRAFSLIPILDREMGPVNQRIYGQIEGCLFWFKRMNHLLSTVVFSEHMQIFFWLWLYIVWGGEGVPSESLSVKLPNIFRGAVNFLFYFSAWQLLILF